MLEGDTIQYVALALGAIAFAAVVFVFLDPYLSGDKNRERRVAVVTEARSKKVAKRSAAETAANRRKAVSDTLKDLETRQTQEKVTMRLRLEQAGLEATPHQFWIASGICGAVIAALCLLFIPESNRSTLATVASTFIGTFGLPRFILFKLTKRRQTKFVSELANSLDVVVRGVKSGLPLNECLGIIARESPEPLASEFREVIDQQRMGVTLSEALGRLADRMPLPEVRFLTIVIGIQQQAGGNLSEALGNLSGVLRDRFRMSMKVKALSSEAKSSAIILASLPPTVMVMVSMSTPDFIQPLFTTKTGTMFITFGLIWMVVGCLVMRKMINFKY